MKAKLRLAVESFSAFMAMGQFLQKQQMNVHSAENFVAKLMENPVRMSDPEFEVRNTRGFTKILDLFEGQAKGSELVGQTKWGMLNAVTEYYDHHLPSRTQDARLNSTWFGSGNAVKAKAIQLLVA